MASAFASILIYAIDLVPHRVGLVGGLFYGLAFGLGGLTAAALGLLADQFGIVAVFKLCSGPWSADVSAASDVVKPLKQVLRVSKTESHLTDEWRITPTVLRSNVRSSDCCCRVPLWTLAV
jgi:hypothetical protein